RKSFIQVLDDDARVIKHEIPVHERWNAVIGIEVEQVLRQLAWLNAHNIDADAFLGQHDPRPMTPGVIRSGKERHDGSSARQISAPCPDSPPMQRAKVTPFARDRRSRSPRELFRANKLLNVLPV